MTKNKRKQPSLQEILERPWCYYCERDFDDLKILINHQKAKHVKCSLCPRRLNTAGGLAVHMQQVHKETLLRIENAEEGRDDPAVEIFGMEGIPDDVRQAYITRKTQEFYAAEAEHRARSGNGPMVQGAVKKVKLETPEEIKARLAEFKAKKAAGQLAGTSGPGTPVPKTESPANVQDESSFPTPSHESSAADSMPTQAQHSAVGSPAPFQLPHGQPPTINSPIPFQHASAHSPTNGQTYPQQAFPHQPYPQPFPTPVGQPFPPAYGLPSHPGPSGPPGPMPGFGGGPPMYPPPYAAQPPPPVYQQSFPHPFQPPYQQLAQPQYPPPFPPQGSPPLGSHRQSQAHQGGGHGSPKHSISSNGPTRQNSLPSMAGLPARPTFDAPPVSRSQLHEMHAGQKPFTNPQDSQSISDGVDDLIAEVTSHNTAEVNHKVQQSGAPAPAAKVEHVNSPRSAPLSPYHGASNGHRAEDDITAAKLETNGPLQNSNVKAQNGHARIDTPPAKQPVNAVQRKETSKSTPTRGERTKKRTFMVVRDDTRTPEEKMARMKRYRYHRRQSKHHPSTAVKV